MEPEDENLDAQKEEEARDALSNFGIKELLEEGHRALLLDLNVKVRAGTATAAEKQQLRQMLKDNGWTWPGMTTPDPNAPPVNAKPVELPDLEDMDE